MSFYDAAFLWLEVMGYGALLYLGARLARSTLDSFLSLFHKEK